MKIEIGGIYLAKADDTKNTFGQGAKRGMILQVIRKHSIEKRRWVCQLNKPHVYEPERSDIYVQEVDLIPLSRLAEVLYL